MCLCDTWYLLFCVDDCLQPFHGKEPHRLQQAGSRAPHGEITVSGMTNSLNYFVIFIVDTQFTNMAAGRIIQAGGPRGGDPHVIEFSPSCSFNFNFKAGALGVYREIFLFLNTLSIMYVPLFKILLKEYFMYLQIFIGQLVKLLYFVLAEGKLCVTEVRL